MDTKLDRRVRRTRQALIDALLALMVDKPYADITVQELIDRADVGRSTFYSHFTGKDGLLDAALDELRAITSSAKPGFGFSLPLLRHIAEHRDLARALFGPAGRDPVAQRMESVLAQAISQATNAGYPESPLPPQAFARFATASYLALVRWWLEAGEPIAVADFDQAVQQLILSCLRLSK